MGIASVTLTYKLLWGGDVIKTKNWSRFQHYRGRRPPWIKLHRGLLDDVTFSRLPDASRALAPMLWLIASESQNGDIDMTLSDLSYRLRMINSDFVSAFKPLIFARYFSCDEIDASKPLSLHKQNGASERETETEKNILFDEEFSIWYKSYPRRQARGDAEKAYKAVRQTVDAKTLLDGAIRAQRQFPEKQYTPLPATWLRDKRWLDEVVPAVGQKPGGGFA